MRVIELDFLWKDEKGHIHCFCDPNVKNERSLWRDKDIRLAGIVENCKVYYNQKKMTRKTALTVGGIIARNEHKEGI